MIKQINADVEAMQDRIANTFATLREAKENRTGANISPDGVRAILQYADWLEIDLATTKARLDELEAK